MVFLQHSETIHPKVLHSLCISTIYNFTYRLSGNTNVAEVLTENVLLRQSGSHKDDVFLLKQAWQEFIKYYRGVDFKGEEPVQQALLALPPELRCSVILRSILGYSYREISIILDKPECEIGVLISEGIQKISRQINVPNITC